MDDAYVNGFIKQLTASSDPILKELSIDFMNRHLFKYIDINKDQDQAELLKN
ncbi:MAG: hypothetical protein L6U99_04630 [Clostridium sp.]|nr:MAG: hypothetical protein L6U99_04630 [Clostridium sp.]